MIFFTLVILRLGSAGFLFECFGERNDKPQDADAAWTFCWCCHVIQYQHIAVHVRAIPFAVAREIDIYSVLELHSHR